MICKSRCILKVQYTMHWDKTRTLKKFPSDKTNVTKNALFFFRGPQLITVLLSIRKYYTSWSTSFFSLKLCVGFSIFDSVLFLLNFKFFSTESMDSMTLKHHNSFQNKNNKKTTPRFSPRHFIFKLQQEIWKYNDICVSRSSPKTDLETKLSKL